jgi:hypothetical protein
MTTISTFGNPTSFNNGAICIVELGDRSDDFRVKLLPQTMINRNIHLGAMVAMGAKLNGIIPASIPIS